MPQQSIFVHGRYLGSREVPAFYHVRAEPWVVHSHNLYCLRCGEIWARFLIPNSEFHQIRSQPCAKHGDGRIAGCPWWDWEPTRFDEQWPLDAIKYEFEVSLNLALKELQCEPA